MIILNEQKNRMIEKIVEKHELDLVVLFGSQVKNTAIKESDIDVGIHGALGLNLDDKIAVARELAEVFQNENIDVSIISSNSPLLMRQILTDGKILYEKEKNLANKLKFYAWKLLAESKPFRDKSFALLKSRITVL